MESFSIREVIEQAVQTEKLGHEFYTKMSERFENDSKLKDLFNELALMEVAHEKIFSDLKDKISDENLENWDEAAKYLRAIVESEFFLGKNKSLPSLGYLDSVKDAVEYALEFEKETLLYYVGLQQAISKNEVIDKIIDEEKSHIIWLSEFKKNL